MGEWETEGSGNYKDRVEMGFRAREKKRGCKCGSEKCDCDNSCPNFKEKKSFLDVIFPRIVRDTMGKISFCGCVIILFFLDVVCPSVVREKMGTIVFYGCMIMFFLAICFFGLS